MKLFSLFSSQSNGISTVEQTSAEELNDQDLEQATGGRGHDYCYDDDDYCYDDDDYYRRHHHHHYHRHHR